MKTIEQKEQQVKNYLNETAKHLFVTKNGVMFKIIPFNHEEKSYVAKVTISKTNFNVSIDDVSKIYDSELKQTWKNRYFDNFLEIKSIKHFKAFNLLFEKFKSGITIDNKKNVESLEKLISESEFLSLVR